MQMEGECPAVVGGPHLRGETVDECVRRLKKCRQLSNIAVLLVPFPVMKSRTSRSSGPACGEVAVGVSSLVTSALVLAAACVHLSYLLEALGDKRRIVEELRKSGGDLRGRDLFLWCLLFAFGETIDLRKVRRGPRSSFTS